MIRLTYQSDKLRNFLNFLAVKISRSNFAKSNIKKNMKLFGKILKLEKGFFFQKIGKKENLTRNI